MISYNESVEPSSSPTGVLMRRRDARLLENRVKATSGYRERMAICKPRRGAPQDTDPADTLILDFQPPEL